MKPTTWREVPVPPLLKAMHPDVRTWQKDLPDGHLTVLLSRDDGMLHLSISHRRDTKAGPVPGRNPRWEEIKEARYRFCPDHLTMAMLLPPKAEYVNVHDTTFHLWEVPQDWAQETR